MSSTKPYQVMQKKTTVYDLFIKVMKFTSIQLALAMALCSMAIAKPNYGQELLSREVTLHLKEVTLQEALKEIESATKVKFSYSRNFLDLNNRVTVDASEKKLGDVLQELLTAQHISFFVQGSGDYIVLINQTSLGDSTDFIYSKQLAGDQNVNPEATTVTGVVVASDNSPLPGVNVVIKGTTHGTTTDTNGQYTIEAEPSDVLIFSFIGFKTQEAKVDAQTEINIIMGEDIATLQEIVVNAGYWQVKEQEKTGNIAKVNAEEIQKQPVQNPLQALQGRVPGLEVTQQTGVPGGNYSVRIRGTNSIANGNDPLYIVDGVPFTSTSMSDNGTSGQLFGSGTNPLNAINPSDIESIEVLKDADATAIYGSRGANGVILITTKKGQAGKMKVDFNFYNGVSKVEQRMDLLNRQQYLDMRKEAFANDNITPTAANARDLVQWDTTRFTDWQKKLIGGTANTTDAQISLSGGDKYTQFMIGTGYHRETTVFPGSNSDQRLSTNISLTNMSPNQKFKTNVSVKYSVNTSNLIREDLTFKALNLSPVAPPLYDQDELSWNNWTVDYENPLANLERRYESTTNNLIGNGLLSYAILPNLEVRTSLGYTNITVKSITVNPISAQAPNPGNQHTTAFWDSNFKNWVIEPQLNWKPKLGEGQFDVLAGTSFLDQTTEGLAQTGYGFTSEALMKNIAYASIKTFGTNYYSQYRYHAVFGRINYSLRGKYIVNLTGRRDGSSRFGSGKQFTMFGAAGAAWIFSEETFVKNAVPFLSFGKLRSSYGITGNDQLGDYQYLDTYSSVGSGSYQGVIGLQPDRLSNPDFAWETNKKLEAGLELGFLNDRIFSAFSYFRNRSSNQLVGYPLPVTTGFNSIQGNFPATVQNTGLEIELRTRNIEKVSFSWTTSFNITIPQNKLVAFPNLEATSYANTYVVGEPLSIRKQYHYTGIDPTTGLYTFEDVNGDGAYDFQDRQTVAFVGRKFYGGLFNSVKYKGFQLDVMFQFVKQTGPDYMNVFSSSAGNLSNQPAFVMNRWTETGDASIQRFGQAGGLASTAFTYYVNSEPSVTDASFVRFKNLSLSYSLPSTLAQKIKVGNVRVFIQGQNLLTITNYRGLDPETQSSRLPPLRVITGGIHLTF
jgi:TonB-linked SusC/RagA family outer membrane protein